MTKVFLYIAIIACALSCKKKEEPYSSTPEIEFISMSPTSTTEFSDKVVIRISYKDGDGDLGTSDPDVYSIFVKDSRLPASDKFHLQPLTPPDQKLQIEGELDIVLSGLFITDTNQSQNASFSVTLKDNAGNTSNAVKTSTLTINKDA